MEPNKITTKKSHRDKCIGGKTATPPSIPDKKKTTLLHTRHGRADASEAIALHGPVGQPDLPICTGHLDATNGTAIHGNTGAEQLLSKIDT